MALQRVLLIGGCCDGRREVVDTNLRTLPMRSLPSASFLHGISPIGGTPFPDTYTYQEDLYNRHEIRSDEKIWTYYALACMDTKDAIQRLFDHYSVGSER